MATKKKSSSGSGGRAKIHKVMKEKKEGTLQSGSGKKVTSRKQAVAIALSEARKSGAKIPKKKSN
jgi:hypothetical protein